MVYTSLPGISEKHGKGPIRAVLTNNDTGTNDFVTVRQGGGAGIRIEIEAPGAAGSTIVTEAGVINLTCALSTGNTNVKMNWSVTIQDPGAGTAAVHTAGTQNNETYDSLRLSITAPSGHPPIDAAIFEVKCTITHNDDGSTPAAQITSEEMACQVTLIGIGE